MHTLFTIGYEKALPAAVLGELRRAKVDLLVDTRAVAASRRPGFSKRQLAAALDDVVAPHDRHDRDEKHDRDRDAHEREDALELLHADLAECQADGFEERQKSEE